MKRLIFIVVFFLVSVISFSQCPYNIIDSKPNKTEMFISASSLRQYILFEKEIKNASVKSNINLSFYADMELNCKWNVKDNNLTNINIDRFNKTKYNVSYNYSSKQLHINNKVLNKIYIIDIYNEYWVYVKTDKNSYKLIKTIGDNLITNVKY